MWLLVYGMGPAIQSKTDCFGARPVGPDCGRLYSTGMATSIVDALVTLNNRPCGEELHTKRRLWAGLPTVSVALRRCCRCRVAIPDPRT